MPVAPNSLHRTSQTSVVARAAAVLGLVWPGDALIYVVMPLALVVHLAARRRGKEA